MDPQTQQTDSFYFYGTTTTAYTSEPLDDEKLFEEQYQRPGHHERRLSYDRNLYKRDLYIRAYSDPVIPKESKEPTSPLGLSSPNLKPAPGLPNPKQKPRSETTPTQSSPIRDPYLNNSGKDITELFLFGRGRVSEAVILE